jgi:hypothetical protein
MKNTRKTRRTLSAEAIARHADKGKDVSRFFTNSGRTMAPLQRALETRPKVARRATLGERSNKN